MRQKVQGRWSLIRWGLSLVSSLILVILVPKCLILDPCILLNNRNLFFFGWVGGWVGVVAGREGV